MKNVCYVVSKKLLKVARRVPLAEIVFLPEQLHGEFTPIQLRFCELEADAVVDEALERLISGGFIYDPKGVWKELKREKHQSPSSYAVNLNGVFYLRVERFDDTFGKSTDQLDG